MRYPKKAATILIIGVLLLSGLLTFASALPTDGAESRGETRGTYYESGDETQTFNNPRDLQSGDTYYGNLNRVDDRSDYFTIEAFQQEVINVHIYITGHDRHDGQGHRNQWLPPDDAPPTPGRPTGVFQSYIYAGKTGDLRAQPIDGAFNFFFIRHYVLNICAPVPQSNAYYVNISLDWFMTPNNYTWEYMMEVDISDPEVITSGSLQTGSIDMDTRDTDWYKIYAQFEDEINGSFEITNFNAVDPTERNVNVWIFPEDLGGYPFSFPWDWSAAPNEPIEPMSILSTYEGWYFIKVRAMNHTNNLPCSYRLKVFTSQVPEFPDTGIQNNYFDRYHHDSDWFKFTMEANQPNPPKPGYWNDVVYFNMTERADAEDLPDFDLYLFGKVPNSKWLDLLDSSFRNDHPDFFDPNRDPNKNTEHVQAAAFYNGTYYVEVNAWNNTGFYDLRWEWMKPALSDMDNLPENANPARAGVYESHIHQARDHYDWYKVDNVQERIRFQFDSFKGTDMFNASLYRYDSNEDEYELITGKWNTWFNFTSREDHIQNLIDVNVVLDDYDLGAGTYFIGVFAAVAAQMAFDEVTNRAFIYKTDDEAQANYELRIWVDDIPPFTRPPQRIKAIPDLTVEEDEDKLDFLELYDYFRDTDVGDEVLRWKATVVSGRLNRLILDQQAATLGFEAADNFHGKVVVKVSAIDRKYLQSSLTWNITFTPINDPPTPLYDTSEPFIYTFPEDSLRQLDFKTLVKDVDRNDVINITYDMPENVNVDIDPDTLVADLVAEQDWFGEEQVTFQAEDLEGDVTPLPVKFIVENVEDNPKVLKEIGEVVIKEDEFATLSMNEYFWDPDGDELQFQLSSNLNVNFQMDGWVMTLIPDPDWAGFRDIWVTAIDTTARTAQTRFIFIVEPVNDDPEIVSVSPAPTEVTVREEMAQSFVVLNVTDPEFSILIYKWYLDGKLVGPSNFYNYKPTYQDQGTHELRVEVTDEEEAIDVHTWTVQVEDVPRPPEGGIASPANNAKFFSNEKIPFVALYYDLDGDEISYQWYVDDKSVSSDFNFEKQLDEGKHRVRLVVQSGDFTVQAFANLTVEKAESPGFEAPLVVMGLAVTFLAAAAWRRRRLA